MTAALLTAVALALLLGGAGGGSGAGATTGAGSPLGATGTVARRTLVERLTATGTIGYAGEATVLARLTGTVTALPSVGDVIRRGGRLYALAGEPVLLLYGAVPAYRTLALGVSPGRDVEQLERNLAILGYSPGSVDEAFTSSTAAAIAAWQEDLGLEATGEVELGRVAFLRGPQRVTGLEATLGEALGGGGGGGGSGNRMVAWEPEAEASVGEAVEAEEPTAEEPETEGERKPSHERAEPKEEPEPEPQREKQPRPEPEPDPKPKPQPEPASVPVLRTSSTRRVVSVELEADQQSIARRGQRVEVVLPAGGKVPGKVRGLAAVESSGGEGGPGEESKPGVEVTISVSRRHRIPALAGTTVSVLFTERVRRAVLSVPLTALVAIGGDRFAVRVRKPGASRQIVVTPGLAADGFVAVKSRGLRPGMTVETGG